MLKLEAFFTHHLKPEFFFTKNLKSDFFLIVMLGQLLSCFCPSVDPIDIFFGNISNKQKFST